MIDDGLTPDLTRLALCAGSIVGVDYEGCAVRWDSTPGGTWPANWLGRVVPAGQFSGVVPMWLGHGFLAVGGHVVRRIGLDGACQVEFAIDTQMEGAAWNGSSLLCSDHWGRVHCLDSGFHSKGSWDSGIVRPRIGFVTNDVVVVRRGREIANYTPSGKLLAPVVSVSSIVLDIEHTDRFVVASSVDDTSVVVDIRGLLAPAELPGFVSGASRRAIWTVGRAADTPAEALTRWRETDSGLGTPSSIDLTFEEWGSQRSSLFELQAGVVAVAFQRGILVLADDPTGEVRVIRRIRPSRTIASALRLNERECVVLFEDGVLETVGLV